MFAVTLAARQRALAIEGATLISAASMRMHGHGAHDDARYVPPARLDGWLRRDCIEQCSARLEELGVDVAALSADADADGAVAEAIELAVATPMADPATLLDGVFCDRELEPLGTGSAPIWSGHRTGGVS